MWNTVRALIVGAAATLLVACSTSATPLTVPTEPPTSSPTTTPTPTPRTFPRADRPTLVANSPSPIPLVTYREPSFGYTISYPSNWNLSEPTLLSETRYSSAFFASQDASITLSISRSEDILEKRREVYDLLSSLINWLKISNGPISADLGGEGSREYSFISLRPVNLAGHEAYEVEYLATSFGIIEHTLELHLLVGKEILYRLVTSVPEEEWNKYENRLRSILASFNPNIEPLAGSQTVEDEACDISDDVVVTEVTSEANAEIVTSIKVSGRVANTCNRGVFVSVNAYAYDDKGAILAQDSQIFDRLIVPYPMPRLYLAPNQSEFVTIIVQNIGEVLNKADSVDLVATGDPEFGTVDR